MKVIRSLSSGYCLGVEKTISNASEILEIAKKKNLPAYCIGELIHNPDIVNYFEKKGLKVIKDTNVEPGIALIRAHGIPKSLENEFLAKGFSIKDSTCKKIVATKNQIKKAISKGRKIMVIGAKGHAEALTLLGVDDTPKFFISSFDELDNSCRELNSKDPVSVAVQSTFSETQYELIKRELKNRYSDIVFLNKLCSVCSIRKWEASKMADLCDAIIVVGGKTSSNTAELANHVEKKGKPVYAIENCNDLSPEFEDVLRKYKTVGVCSGTSTPSSILDAVCNHLESL